MTKIKYTLIIACLCFYHTGLYAQIPGAPTMALSPNAASFRLYGDVPVSHFTGVPEITIPLYNLQVQDFTLPIFLSYHAGGVRVDQRAGWTGVNWTLFAGGIITRTVNDRKDEYNNPGRLIGIRSGEHFGFYFNHNVLNTNYWRQRNYLRFVAQGGNEFRDTAPDEFFFSFPGYSGRFFLDHNGNSVVQSSRPVRVKLDGFLQIPFTPPLNVPAHRHGYSPSFSGFTITTGNGTRFQFGGKDTAIDFSMNFFNQYADYWIATAWHLTKITLPNGHKINFRYERGAFINQLYIAVHQRFRAETVDGHHYSCSQNISILPPIAASYQGKLISPAYLRKIYTEFATISFDRSPSDELSYAPSIYQARFNALGKNESRNCNCFPILRAARESNESPSPLPPSGHACLYDLNQLRWYKLDSIIIQNQTDRLKTIKFSYNNIDTERLFLESVQRSGENPYFFSYYNRGGLPHYLANKSDHWGFFNNTYACIRNFGDYHNHRNPNRDVLKYGILTRITYPTGGFTEFEFEPHYFRQQLRKERWLPLEQKQTNQLAGGLRIRGIKHSATPDGEAQTVREFFYVTDFLQHGRNASFSSGILGGRTQYYFTDYMIYAYNRGNARKRISVFSSNSVLPASRNTISHIGYSEVIEVFPDNSFTRFRFSNFGPGNMDKPAIAIIQTSRTPYERYISRAHRRGLLLSKETYSAEGVKISSKTIEYEPDATTNNYVRAMNTRIGLVCPFVDDPWHPLYGVRYDEGVAYRIYTYSMRPRVITERLFENNNTIVTRTEFRYNSRNLISEISTLHSDGRTQRVRYHYPFEVLEGYQFDILRQMTDRHIVSNYVNRILLLDDLVVGGETRIFGRFGDNSNPIFRPKQIQRLRLDEPINKNQFYRIRNQDFSLRINGGSHIHPIQFRYQNIDIRYPAKIALEVALIEISSGSYSFFYDISIRNNATNEIIFNQSFSGAFNSIPLQGHYSFNDSFFVDLPPGSYQINFRRSATLPCRNPNDCPTDMFYNSHVHLQITETPTNIVHPAFQSEIAFWYDNRGNVTEVRLLDCNSVTTYFWGYNGRYPVIEVRGKTIDDIQNSLRGADASFFSFARGTTDTAILRSLGEMLRRSLSGAFVTTFTYRPLVGVTSITDPRGITTFYEYDSFGRLVKIYRMNNGRREILQTFEYHFRNSE